MSLSNSRIRRVSAARGGHCAATGMLIIALSASCAAYQPLVSARARHDDRELRTYESNLVHWNVLSARFDTMEPIPPPDPAHPEALAAHVAGLNRMFRIAFDIVSADSSEDTTNTGGESPDPAQIRQRADGRVVTIYFDQVDDDEPPHVRGILLSESGWVLTVRHPFEDRGCSPDQAYIRVPGHDGAYPIVSCRSGSGQNVMLAKFDIAGNGEAVEPGSPPPFSVPRDGETGFLLIDRDVISIEISDTGVPLQIGSDLVYERNFIADAPESIDEAVSGTAVWNRFGEIIGLYYHRAVDGSTVGFAALSDLPRQIGEAVRAVQREVNRERR